MIKDRELDEYLFGIDESDLTLKEFEAISASLHREMLEIFYGRNIPSRAPDGGRSTNDRRGGRLPGSVVGP